jgi:hypothetical protein
MIVAAEHQRPAANVSSLNCIGDNYLSSRRTTLSVKQQG